MASRRFAVLVPPWNHSDVTLTRLEREVEHEVQEAIDFAEQSPEPDPARLFEFS